MAQFKSPQRVISSFLDSEHDTRECLARVCLVALAAIILLGPQSGDDRTSNPSTLWDRLDSFTNAVISPLYAVLAILYLTAVAFRQDLRSFWDQLHHPSKSSAGADLQPPRVDDTIDHLQRQLAIDEQDRDDGKVQPVDLTGVYRLVTNENFEAFLAAQGVPWALRSAANRARPIHRITHRGRVLTIKIEGIIESQTTYLIDGPPVETNVRGRIFEDVVNFLDGERRGIIVRKKALTEEYDVAVQRELSEDGAVITMTSTATFRDGRPFVQSKQTFHRVIE
jgi:hypothetical protein